MATEDLERILRVPGRLCVGPTQAGLLDTFPHGGTALGAVAEAYVEETEEVGWIRAYELGQIVGGARGFSAWNFGFVLRQWDADALAAFFARTSTASGGGFTGARTVLASRAGPLTPSSPLLFAPFDPTHPGVLIYSPIPYAGAAARRLEFSLARGLEVPLLVMATRRSGRRSASGSIAEPVAIDLLEHLSVT